MKPLCATKTVSLDRLGTMTLKRWQQLADQLMEIEALTKDRADAKAAFSTKFLPYDK